MLRWLNQLGRDLRRRLPSWWSGLLLTGFDFGCEGNGDAHPQIIEMSQTLSILSCDHTFQATELMHRSKPNNRRQNKERLFSAFAPMSLDLRR